MKSKGANENESRRIIYLMAGMASGLKILVSAVQSSSGRDRHHKYVRLVSSAHLGCVV